MADGIKYITGSTLDTIAGEFGKETTLPNVTVTAKAPKKKGSFWTGLSTTIDKISSFKLPTVDMTQRLESSPTSWGLIAVLGLLAFALLRRGKKLF